MRYQQEVLQVQCEAWRKGAVVGPLQKMFKMYTSNPSKRRTTTATILPNDFRTSWFDKFNSMSFGWHPGFLVSWWQVGLRICLFKRSWHSWLSNYQVKVSDHITKVTSCYWLRKVFIFACDEKSARFVLEDYFKKAMIFQSSFVQQENLRW